MVHQVTINQYNRVVTADQLRDSITLHLIYFTGTVCRTTERKGSYGLHKNLRYNNSYIYFSIYSGNIVIHIHQLKQYQNT